MREETTVCDATQAWHPEQITVTQPQQQQQQQQSQSAICISRRYDALTQRRSFTLLLYTCQNTVVAFRWWQPNRQRRLPCESTVLSYRSANDGPCVSIGNDGININSRRSGAGRRVESLSGAQLAYITSKVKLILQMSPHRRRQTSFGGNGHELNTWCSLSNPSMAWKDLPLPYLQQIRYYDKIHKSA